MNWPRKQLFNLVLWASKKYTSKPIRERVFRELSLLHKNIKDGKETKGVIIPFDATTDKFIIFSDQHKGAKNGADDFMLCEPNYLAALDYYFEKNFAFISLGDSEELWENLLFSIKKAHAASFEKEKQFITRNAFYKIFGNHDLFWANDPFAPLLIKDIYQNDLPIYEGIILKTEINKQPLEIFCTHGHQGDKISDGNWFSKFFISRIWAPLQAFTKINPNTPAYDSELKSLHNSMMYEWSQQYDDVILITGHTHQPVFKSLTYIERLYKKLLIAKRDHKEKDANELIDEIKKRKFEEAHFKENYLQAKPGYFNAGCCCYNDGDITGIEISNGCISLIKWKRMGSTSEREVLEEAPLSSLQKKEPLV